MVIKKILALFLVNLLTINIAANAVLIYKEMPNFNQTNSKYGDLPGGGKNYCAPVAVSNALIWLSNNGFIKLTSKGKTKIDQYQLVETLASNDYMKTDLTKGTTIYNTIKGLEKYAKDSGYKIKIERKGLGDIPGYQKGKQPSPNWIANGLLSSSNVLLNLGWYEYDKKKDLYTRVGGHYVTVAGIKGNKLVIHDPASNGRKNDYLSFVKINSGYFDKSGYNNEIESAKDFWKMSGIQSSNKVAIIDGAIRFKVFNTKPLADIKPSAIKI